MFEKFKAFFSKLTNGQPEKKEKKTGFIKYFNRSRGFGFIRSKQTKRDVFVHFQDLKDKIYAGDKVSFVLEHNEKGLRARNVELAD